MLTKVDAVRVLDREGADVGRLLEAGGGYIEIELPDGSTRWYTDCLVVSHDPEVVRLGLRREALRLYGLKARPATGVRPEFFLG